MDGMPIQYLNGVDDELLGSTILDIMTGKDLLQGLGSTNPADADKGMYDYLVKTRNVIAARPDMVTNQNPADALRMYDYAIKYWNTPNRDKALEVLEREESKLMGLGAIVYPEGVDGLGGFWSSVKNVVKKTGQAVAKGAKFVANTVLRFNPISIAARTGVQLALRLNFNKISEKLYPGYLTPAQAQAQGISPEQHQKAIDALNNVKKLYNTVLKGKPDKLQKAIEYGSRKKWTKPIIEDEKSIINEVEANKNAKVDMEEDDGVDGLGEPVTATASAAAAAPFLVKIWNWTKGLVSKSEGNVNVIKDIANEVQEGKDNVNEVVKTVKDATGKSQPQTPQQPKAATPTEKTDNNSQTNNTMAENPNPSLMDKLKQPKTLLLIGSVALLAGGIYYMATRKPAPKTVSSGSQPAALSGIKSKKRRPARAKRKTSAKPKTAPRRRNSSVKSLKLK